jgi:hypothetical protein
MKRYFKKLIARWLGLCVHDWELGMKNGTIHKVCYKCNSLIDTRV